MWIRSSLSWHLQMSMCVFLSFPSIKQSLFSFSGFNRNLSPGLEPALTLALPRPELLNRPHCSIKGAFSQSPPPQKKNPAWNYSFVNIFNSILLLFFLFPSGSSVFVSELLPNSGVQRSARSCGCRLCLCVFCDPFSLVFSPSASLFSIFPNSPVAHSALLTSH